MSKQVVLSISLLASNRPDTIRRCLDSLVPIMEQIPSELILVDTSKNEELHNILLEYTNKVVMFDWCNDFAKARNVGLKLATGEWFMFLDDDEWFVDIEPLLHFFQSGEYKEYTCANYLIRNFYDAQYINYSDSWVSRMVKRTKDTLFYSKIHEYIYPAGNKCKSLPALAYHSGYIFETEEERRKHFERNAALLLDMIEKEPDKLRWRVQLAQEYRSIKEWDALYAFCKDSIEQTNSLDDTYSNLDIGTFYAGITESLLFLKRYEESVEWGKRAFEDRRNSPLCLAYIDLCMSMVYFYMGKWAEAEAYTHQYLKLSREIPKNRKAYEEQQGALLVNEAFDKIPMKRAYSILICCGLKKNDTVPLRKFFAYLEWHEKVIYCFDGFLKTITEAFARLPYEPIFLEVAQHMWNNSELQRQFFVEAESVRGLGQTEFKRIQYIVSQLEGEHWYPYYTRIFVADESGQATDMEKLFLDFFAHSTNVFMTPSEVLAIAKKNHVSEETLYYSVSFERWTEHLRDYLSKAPQEDILLLESQLASFSDNVRKEYAFMRIAETRVLYSEYESDFLRKQERLVIFSERVQAFYGKYYRADILEYYRELLPLYAQAGLIIGEALAMEGTDSISSLKIFKSVVDIYPTFAGAIKKYILAVGQERERRERQAKEEMRQLVIKTKEQVKLLIEAGHYDDAIDILSQLKPIRPNDLDVAELTLRARLGQLEG